jgi:hypothetical protein
MFHLLLFRFVENVSLLRASYTLLLLEIADQSSALIAIQSLLSKIESRYITVPAIGITFAGYLQNPGK